MNAEADEADDWDPEVESNADAKPKAESKVLASAMLAGEQDEVVTGPHTSGDELLDQLTTRPSERGVLLVPDVGGLLFGKCPRLLSAPLDRLVATNPEVHSRPWPVLRVLEERRAKIRINLANRLAQDTSRPVERADTAEAEAEEARAQQRLASRAAARYERKYSELLEGFTAAEAALNRAASQSAQQREVARVRERDHMREIEEISAENDELRTRIAELTASHERVRDTPGDADGPPAHACGERAEDGVLSAAGEEIRADEEEDRSDDGSDAESDHSAERRRDRLLCAAASLDASFSPDHPGAEATSGYGEKGGGDDIHDDNDDHLCDDNTTEGDTSTAPFVPPRQQHPPPGFERNVQTALDEPPAAWAGGTPPRRKHASTPTEAGVVERRSRESILHARIA